jgi:PEP-CTERM motif
MGQRRSTDPSTLEGEKPMKQRSCTHYLTKALLAASVVASVAVAHAGTLNITYFTIAETDKDGGDMCCGVSTNYVQSALGANGLPVFNPGATATSGSVFTPHDLITGNQISWWSPTLNNGGAMGTSDVTQSGSGVVSLPYTNNDFYPPNGKGPNDLNGFQGAILSGDLFAPTKETVSFSIASDDMAFLYINGQIACDDGGVHAATAVPCTSSVLPEGNNSIELFYVDLNPTGAELDFSITTAGVTTSPIPEPGSFALLGSGLLGLAGLVRWKMGKPS